MVHPDCGISRKQPKVNKNADTFSFSSVLLQSINRCIYRIFQSEPIFDDSSRELFQPSAPELSLIDDIKNDLIL